MAQLAPILLALILNLSGFYIFRNPKESGGDKENDAPLMSSVLFAIGVVILILDTRLYPCSFRPLHWIIDYLYQYLIGTFILEVTLNDFWFPFENIAMQALPNLGDSLEAFAKKIGYGEDTMKKISDILKTPEVTFAWSYFLSSMFLICVLHATRIIDIRILTRYGPCAFFEDIWSNLKLIKKNIMNQICGETPPPPPPKGCSRGNPGSNPKRKKRNDSETHACNDCYY